MKINTLLESVQLDEDLGNLAQLNLGKLAGLLKQDPYSGVTNKFTAGAHSAPGNTSEIVDVGPLKKGIVGLRKAYRAYTAPADAPRGYFGSPHVVGFAVYLNNRAVAFGLFTADSLAGRTREGKFAYDLSGFEEQIDAVHSKENEGRPSWNQVRKMEPNSAYEKDQRIYSRGLGSESKTERRQFVGSSTRTEDLSTFLTRLDQIAEEIGGTITLKLITNDYMGSHRSQKRKALSSQEVRDAGKELKLRLARFKNAKRPTADTIHRFLEMATTKAANVVNFAGRPWKTTPGNSYGGNISPVELMSGKPFVIEYASADPGSYSSIKISYRYDAATNTIKPWQAQWEGTDRTQQTIAMDPAYWLQSTFDIPDLEKPTVIKKMLTMIKDNPSETAFRKIERGISTLREIGIDWPELAIIEKSIATERNKPKAQ